jgi:predicted kinase
LELPNLIILAGLPGSGKSTWAKSYFDLKYKIVSSDAIRARLAGSLREAHDKEIDPWDVFYQEITEALRHGVDVVADATFLTVRHRDRIRLVAETLNGSGYSIKTHFVLFKNIWTALARNSARGDESRVPAEVMDGMRDLYDETLVRLDQERYDSVMTIESYQ